MTHLVEEHSYVSEDWPYRGGNLVSRKQGREKPPRGRLELVTNAAAPSVGTASERQPWCLTTWKPLTLAKKLEGIRETVVKY